MNDASPGPDWARLRGLFPVLARKTYLNSCSYGALATPVRAAFQQYLESRDRDGSDWDWWVAKNENMRQAMAEFLGATTDEIAITASASAGINALASALDFNGPRNKVVISDFEFPTNGQIWDAQTVRGANVVRVPATGGYIPLENFAEAIDESTLLVAITNVCYRNGARLDIAGIAELARRSGAMILVDGYQSLGSIRFDVATADVDFLVGGNLKYLLGTAGIGFMFVRRSLIESLRPTVTGWFAQEDIGAMDHTANRPAANARRFESGTPPVPNCYAAEAGIRVLLDVGMADVESRIRMLVDAVIDRAQQAGYRIVTPIEPERRGAMVNIACTDADRMVAALDEKRIVASCRDGALRISLHFYNNEQDLEHLFSELEKNQRLIERA